MNEEIGRYAAGIFVVAAPAEETRQVKRVFLRCAQELLPVHGFRRCIGRDRVDPGAARGVSIVGGANHGYLAELSRTNPVPGLLLNARADALRADLHELATALDGGGDGVTFIDAVGQGLFAVDVLARVEGLDHVLFVPMIRRSHGNHVDAGVGQHFLVAGIDLGPPVGPCLGSLETSGIGVADAGDLGARDLLDRFEQFLGPRADGDHANRDAVIGPVSALRGRQAQRSRAAEKNTPSQFMIHHRFPASLVPRIPVCVIRSGIITFAIA